MKDIMGMMKAASEMKGKMEAMQAELANMVIENYRIEKLETA